MWFRKEVRVRDIIQGVISIKMLKYIHTGAGHNEHVQFFSSDSFFSGRVDDIGQLHLLDKIKRIQETTSLTKEEKHCQSST